MAAFVTTDVARAIVDLNRARHDRRADGVVKTHTCWNVGVWRRPLSQAEVEGLLDAYHAPYHHQLTELGHSGRWVLGVDCHTMAATGPPLGPDPGRERPWVCLSNGDGTCPQEWIETLQQAFQQQLDGPVRVNDPFRGGHITRSHSAEMPWIQIELSRAPYLSNTRKASRKVAARAADLQTLGRSLRSPLLKPLEGPLGPGGLVSLGLSRVLGYPKRQHRLSRPQPAGVDALG